MSWWVTTVIQAGSTVHVADEVMGCIQMMPTYHQFYVYMLLPGISFVIAGVVLLYDRTLGFRFKKCLRMPPCERVQVCRWGSSRRTAGGQAL